MTLGHRQHWDDTYYLDTDDMTLNVEPSERVGPPLPSRYRRSARRMFIAALVLGGAWVVAADDGGPESWVSRVRALADSAVARVQDFAAEKLRSLPQQNPSADVAASELLETQSSVAELPPAITQTHVEDAPPAATEGPSGAAIGADYSEKADEADDAKDKSPQRKRAMAAGLGADLPNVLLTRLSTGDLENAAYAIKTAVAKTPDDAAFAWPPSPSREQALFEVRFVAGGAEGCRRYIVKVTKDRWSSTSGALEACGVTIPHAG